MSGRGYIEFWNPLIIQRSKTLPKIPPRTMSKGLFSDNALVCYKPGTISYGGVGTVRNGRAKYLKT